MAWHGAVHGGEPALEVSNRFFTGAQEASGQETAVLSKVIDPFGILAKAGDKCQGVHLQDNVVSYFERRPK